MRALKIAGAAVAAVIVIVAVLLIVGVPSGFLTSAIQDRVERETGYRLTIAGSTKIGLWPSLNVTLNDVTLEAPKDRDSSNRVTVGSVQADMTLKSVWSGHPQITELVITRPVLHHPLLRERERLPAPATSPAASSDGTDANALAIDRVTIVDGTMVMFNLRDRVENRIEGINAEALIGDDRNIKVTGRARAGEHPLSARRQKQPFFINAFQRARVEPFEERHAPREALVEVLDLAAHRGFRDRRDLGLQPAEVRDFVDAFDRDERRIHVHREEPEVGETLAGFDERIVERVRVAIDVEIRPLGRVGADDAQRVRVDGRRASAARQRGERFAVGFGERVGALDDEIH